MAAVPPESDAPRCPCARPRCVTNAEHCVGASGGGMRRHHHRIVLLIDAVLVGERVAHHKPRKQSAQGLALCLQLCVHLNLGPTSSPRACRRRRSRSNSSPACQLAVLAPAVPFLCLGQPGGLCKRRAVIVIIEHQDVRRCLAARPRPVHLVVLAPKEEVIFI
jgi:hypothetical protein